MTSSSTYIMDLPDNVTMGPYDGISGGGISGGGISGGGISGGGISGGGISGGGISGSGRQGVDRGLDMESTTYRQLNPHQNPFIQGQQRMDAMPHPEYGSGRSNSHMSNSLSNSHMSNSLPPPPSLPPSYDFDQGPLGSAPQFSLPPKDIPLDTSRFRDESAKPNYVPPARWQDNYVQEQEERIRETKTSDETQKAINRKFDIIAEFQMPIVVAVIFLIFQADTINILMARYLKFAGFFGEDGNINILGILFKSAAFGCAYYGVTNAAKWVE